MFYRCNLYCYILLSYLVFLLPVSLCFTSSFVYITLIFWVLGIGQQILINFFPPLPHLQSFSLRLLGEKHVFRMQYRQIKRIQIDYLCTTDYFGLWRNHQSLFSCRIILLHNKYISSGNRARGFHTGINSLKKRSNKGPQYIRSTQLKISNKYQMHVKRWDELGCMPHIIDLPTYVRFDEEKAK